MPTTNTITAFWTFSPLTPIQSAQVNTNFSNYRGHLLPISPGTITADSTGSYNVGSTDYNWLGVYSKNIFLSEYDTTTSAPTPGSGYRSIYSKQDDNLYTKDDAGAEKLIQTGPVGGLSYQTITSGYTITSLDDVIFANASAASFNLSMFTASSSDGKFLRILNESDTLSAVNIVATTATGLINDTTTVSLLTKNETYEILSESNKWRVVKHEIPGHEYSFTPIISSFSIGNGTQSGVWWRAGNVMKGYVNVEFGTTSVLSGSPGLTVPGGFNIDLSVAPIALGSIIGEAGLEDSGTNGFRAHIYVGGTQTVGIVAEYTGANYASLGLMSATIPFTWSQYDKIYIDLAIPIEGWNAL